MSSRDYKKTLSQINETKQMEMAKIINAQNTNKNAAKI